VKGEGRTSDSRHVINFHHLTFFSRTPGWLQEPISLRLCPTAFADSAVDEDPSFMPAASVHMINT
jgi:hypothetical protein